MSEKQRPLAGSGAHRNAEAKQGRLKTFHLNLPLFKQTKAKHPNQKRPESIKTRFQAALNHPIYANKPISLKNRAYAAAFCASGKG